MLAIRPRYIHCEAEECYQLRVYPIDLQQNFNYSNEQILAAS